MKHMKKSLTLILCLLIVFSTLSSAFAGDISKAWENKWADYDNNIAPAVTMFPGSDESERYIAWYSTADEGYVELITEDETKTFTATATAVPNGTYRLGAVITDLTAGDYRYICYSGEFVSKEYSFTVESTDRVTAMYVSDIHMAIEEDNENSLAERSYIYNEALKAAASTAEKNGDNLDIIISGGDQASEGLTEEFIALSSPEYMKTIPFAPAIGNHDRKSVGYKYYTFLPNEADMTFKSYIGSDYWVRYGDVLFLMYDSCNTSMRGHYKFTKEAVKANEDAVWIIATMHHDMFGGREEWLYTENKLLRFLWTPLFDRYGIDLCLYGHSHYYSVSDVIYKNKSVELLKDKAEVTDPTGTVYLSSGSVNNFAPLLTDEGTVPPVGENTAFTYLEGEDSIYTLLDFSGKTLTMKSYTADNDEAIYSLKINKTTDDGGHEYKKGNFIRRWFTYFVSRIVNVINNVDMYNRYKEQGFEVSLKQGLIGS